MQRAAQSEAVARAGGPGWLTPGGCRVLLGLLLGGAFVAHLAYLKYACPFDLTSDEAHYWDWSRQLGLSYYSKGPLVAYIIRGSCELFGTSAVAVRVPALLFAAGSSLCTYWLTRKLFGSERVALAAVVINHVVPLFVAGSLLMTIDPPFCFCWALATCLAAKAIFDERRWPWPLIGVVLGVGFLAKYGMMLWLVSLVVMLGLDRGRRRLLVSRWPWMGVGISLLFTIPVIVWNAQHGWASMGHVARQTGAAGGGPSLREFAEFLAGQVGVIGPIMFGLMVWAMVRALGGRAAEPRTLEGIAYGRASVLASRPPVSPTAARTEPRPPGGEGARTTGGPPVPRLPGRAGGAAEGAWRSQHFLVWMALPFLALVVLSSLRAKAQANWAAPAYFTLMILTAKLMADLRHGKRWSRLWNVLVCAAIVTGLAMVLMLHNLEPLYPLLHRLDPSGRAELPRKLDPTVKYKGYAKLGRLVSDELGRLDYGAFVLCEDYQTAAEMAFYVDGRPKTYCAGSYFADPRDRKRLTQYDMWTDRSLEPGRSRLIGQNAIYVGYRHDLHRVFDRIVEVRREERPELELKVRGLAVRTFRVARCYGFKGMQRPTGPVEK